MAKITGASISQIEQTYLKYSQEMDREAALKSFISLNTVGLNGTYRGRKMVMKAAKFVIAVAGMAWGSSALAESWIFYANGSAGKGIYQRKTAHFYDADSVQRQGDYVIVWASQSIVDSAGKSFRSQSVRTAMNCKKMTSTMLYFVHYDFDGSVIISSDIPVSERTEDYIVPGTIISSLYERVCK